MDTLTLPWPWFVVGPLIGLFVPALLVLGNKQLGISSNLRHLCAAVAPGKVQFFRYDWKKDGAWNLAFLVGIVVGGVIGGRVLGAGSPDLSSATREALGALGVTDFSGLAPRQIFGWASLATLRGLVFVVVGGFLVGFGTAYGGGCTSGHAISGLAAFQKASLVAVIAFFAGGLIATHLLLPLVLP